MAGVSVFRPVVAAGNFDPSKHPGHEEDELTAAFDESKIKRQPAGKRDSKSSPDDGGKFAPKEGGGSKAQSNGDDEEDDSKDDPGIGEEGDEGTPPTLKGKERAVVDKTVDELQEFVNKSVEGDALDKSNFGEDGLLNEKGLKANDERWNKTLAEVQKTDEYDKILERGAAKVKMDVEEFEQAVLDRTTGGDTVMGKNSPGGKIERQAEEWVAKGYQPKDSEPGEWLKLENDDGDVVTIGPDGVEDSDDEDDEDVTASADPLLGLTAAAAGMVPVHPPAEWFDDPKLDGPTPLEVTADGRVFGHLAAFGTCHIANPRGAGVCVEPPTSETGYGYFHLGQVEAEDGRRVHVGQITMDSPHAPMGATARTASSHYDNTGTAAADVRAGEDEHGIWVAGALRPSLTATAARTLMGAKLSGDWRGVKGNLELVGILAVNVPGFPVPRPRVLMADAAPVSDEWPEVREALVAAGVVLEKPVDEAAVRRRVRVMAVRAAGGKDALVAMATDDKVKKPAC